MAPLDPLFATPSQLESFNHVKWVQSYLKSPSWEVYQRTRGSTPSIHPDRFIESTVRAHDGVSQWLEAYQQPQPGSKTVTKTLSLIQFGNGLHGFPGITHGGASLALMDDALGFVAVANAIEEMGYSAAFENFGGGEWRNLLAEGKAPEEVLRGRMVTAKMEVQFVRPVKCPGMVGVECEVLEDGKRKMRVRGIMRDEEGKEVLRAESVWVRIGSAAKM